MPNKPAPSQSKVNMIPLGASALPDIMDVEPLGESDMSCLAEVKEVLNRFGKLERFGISLLHGHFPVGPDEFLVETCDYDRRELVTKPMKRSDPNVGPTIQTNWQFKNGDAESIMDCRKECRYDWVGNHHYTTHYKS